MSLMDGNEAGNKLFFNQRVYFGRRDFFGAREKGTVPWELRV